MKVRAAVALFLVAACAAAAYQVRIARQQSHAHLGPGLTAYVPQDALLTIESPDFASLLTQWSYSVQSKRWLASDNYAVFQNSRLFGRLGDAQTNYAKAAGIPAGVSLLHQLAGKESVFAWHDIGRLEFLYITRMPAAQAEQTRLFRARGSFERRHAGHADFYVRSSDAQPGHGQGSGADSSTVAFAEIPSAAGDLVLLATREDLIANALTLLAGKEVEQSDGKSAAGSVQEESWFHDASGGLPAENSSPALHMVLNLDRIARDPHFRSYWVQRNITWTRQFRAAASDLYIDSAARFREERVLIPKSPLDGPVGVDLASLAALAPPRAGVFRAAATQDPAVAIAALQDKLIGSSAATQFKPEAAPGPDLAAPESVSASDLETRSDTPTPDDGSASTDSLAQVLRSASLDAVLTVSSAHMPAEGGLWVPVHSAVVLQTAVPVDPQRLASALQETLRGSLTAGNLGIRFKPGTPGGAAVQALTGPRPLFLAITADDLHRNLVLLADDQASLTELLRRRADTQRSVGPPQKAPASLIAVFNHASQRAAYLRLTSLIDGTHLSRDSGGTAAPSRADGADSAPAFFSRNIGSLSDTFAELESEQVVEGVVDSNLRQTVTYSWKTP